MITCSKHTTKIVARKRSHRLIRGDVAVGQVNALLAGGRQVDKEDLVLLQVLCVGAASSVVDTVCLNSDGKYDVDLCYAWIPRRHLT